MEINNPEKRVILILGKRGQGKSFLLKQNLSKFNRFLVYDTLGEYSDGVIFTSYQELFTFWSNHLEGDFRLIYQPLQPDIEFAPVCELVYSCGDMVFIVEEVDRFCDSLHLPAEFANIIQRGRHRDITLIAVSQRPYRVNRTLSSQCKEIYTFQQSEPRDIDFMKEFIGQDVDKIRDLPLYHYLHWKDNQITVDKENS